MMIIRIAGIMIIYLAAGVSPPRVSRSACRLDSCACRFSWPLEPFASTGSDLRWASSGHHYLSRQPTEGICQ